MWDIPLLFVSSWKWPGSSPQGSRGGSDRGEGVSARGPSPCRLQTHLPLTLCRNRALSGADAQLAPFKAALGTEAMGIPLPLGDSSDRGAGPSWRQVADSQGTCQGRGSVPSVAGLRGAGGSPPDSPRFPGTTCHPGQLQTQGSGQRGALGRGATCSPDLCTGSFGRFPSCPSDPAAPWRHTAALGRVSNGPRLEGPAARVTPKPGLCSGLFSLTLFSAGAFPDSHSP